MARSSTVKVLLAAITCEKGDIDGNLARHCDVLAEAQREGCDLAVFPEFSLTGSVDPIAHPERAIALDHPAVGKLTDVAADHGVAALFGIAERAGDDIFITQVLSSGGFQRKRRLGEDEDGFSTGDLAACFTHAHTNFGTMICAEGNHAELWDAVRDTVTTDVVFYCSAPGLYERRTTPADWQRGFEWWGEAGLANAQRHAKRLNLWVGMATQAGSTIDEDFPGIAALIDPEGEIVARLPDWRPGTLVVEIPVENPVSE